MSKPINIFDEMDNSISIVAFMNTSLVSISAQKMQLGEDEISGMQQILFNLEDKLRGMDDFLTDHMKRDKAAPEGKA
ncbi:MAG: hypothetical protein JJE30_06030 [Desulfuromonadales bacterium]|nr:hypothetical protein [Desulfuromonadales bacterium]